MSAMLATAVLCADCEMVSASMNCCEVCGSKALYPIWRLIEHVTVEEGESSWMTK